jgi:hypothetical protein
MCGQGGERVAHPLRRWLEGYGAQKLVPLESIPQGSVHRVSPLLIVQVSYRM